MEENIKTPVPFNQIPLEEFIELKNSSFFSWPIQSGNKLNINISIFWLISIPIFVIITNESYNFKEHMFQLLSVSLISSFIVPLILLIRQYFGWNYIYKRLISKIITYEESDWHDGQIWIKPETWKARDMLIANQDVIPIIRKISESIKLFFFTMLTISLLFLLISHLNQMS